MQVKIGPHALTDSVKTVVITSGASLSDVIDLGSFNLVAIEMPSAWDAASITIAASSAINGTFNPVYDDTGTEVTITTGVSRIIGLDTVALKVAALRYIKLRSGTSATPVNQTANRTIKLICK